MKDILLVDDELPFLLSLKDGLSAYSAEFNVILASTVREALNILKIMDVDLLVTDLKLPEADGFQLMASVSKTHPHLPVIVMTAFGTPEIEARLSQMSGMHYLEKPLDFDELTQTIESALASESNSFIRGITLATFLQLVHMERKTCTLKIRTKERIGYLFLKQGELLDAQTSEQMGEAAGLDILSWDDTEIEMDNRCRRTKTVITSSLEFLLMEAFRIKDERTTPYESEKIAVETTPDEQETEDLLLDLLTRSPDIRDLAIFDNTNFLEHQQGSSTLLPRLDAGAYFALCDELEQVFNAGTLKFLQFTTESKRRHLLFLHNHNRIAVTLEQGARAEKVLGEIASARHATAQLSARGEI
jgi:DNA-binding response OmpR family regulator